MMEYTIHLKTVADFRNYINMLSKHNLSGYVEDTAKGYRTDIHYYMDIISHCPLNDLNLVLTDYRQEDIPDIEQHLGRYNLLNSLIYRVQNNSQIA